MRYKLQVYNSATAAVEREWILHLPATVGRSPDADVSIGDDSISRRHCQFFLNASGALSVHDFNSMNGTYVDDQRIKKRAVLKPGDVVRVGSISLKLEWTDEELTQKQTMGKPSVTTTQPMRLVTKNDLR
ncbi:MAG: FHA domain-containing protein [Mariniblastus sp.]|jgi:pSer/pThr/pTyr-binding forkhead associated (FHA) protein|nr:FHA domain-containing protein [bacterium]MDB2525422.1 FHA domain-containing protein [Mariniblastus sp.]MDG1512017.1 FHA domain-containing protein [Mariniblastus sp.]MDG2183070.1 FHA domain-containing protein [Mariniblastus sp.]